MPRVLVLGATGYLGNAVATTLVQSGLHRVYGLCRSASKSHALAAAEITPVVCEDPANAPEPYLDAIRKYRIDVVIDCTAAYGDSAKFLTRVKELGKARADAFRAEGIASPPKMGFIYVSGAWVHGDSAAPVTDLDPVGTPSAQSKAHDIVAWRPELERLILASRDVLDVLIMRPAQMHGRASAGWTPLWASIAQAVAENKPTVQVTAPPTSQSPLVHVDDVAAAICLGVGKISLLGGSSVYPIFDLVSSTENIRDVLEGLVRSLSGGSSGAGAGKDLKLEFTGPGDNVYFKALCSTIVADSSRAKELLGWQPKRPGLVIGMDVYAAAWKASQK